MAIQIRTTLDEPETGVSFIPHRPSRPEKAVTTIRMCRVSAVIMARWESLDGLPRPVHLDHGVRNIQFDRETDWVTRELGRVIHGSQTRAALWKATIDQLLDFLECWGWPVLSRPYFQRLHQCHLVVNVYKHGEGISFEKLHKDAPQFLKRDDFPEPLLRFPPDYTNLTVTDDDLDQFSDAIVAFWQDVPENTFASQIGDLPKWLKNAIEKDQPPA